MSIRGSGASFDTIYTSDQQFRLRIVATVGYLFILHYIANDTSQMNTSVTRFGIIKQCSDYNYKSLCSRVNWLCFTSCKSVMCNEAPVRILH